MPDHPPISDTLPDREAMIADLLQLAKDMPTSLVRWRLILCAGRLIGGCGGTHMVPIRAETHPDLVARLDDMVRRLSAAWIDDKMFCSIQVLENIQEARMAVTQ